MSVATTAKKDSTLTVEVDEYGIRHRIHGAAAVADVPRVQDCKVVGDEVFYQLGDATLLEAAIRVEGILVVDIRIPGVDDTQLYTITMQPEGEASADYEDTSDGGATEDEILAMLHTAVNGNGGFSSEVRNHGGAKLLRIWRPGDLKPFTVALVAGGAGAMTQTTVGSLGDAVMFGGLLSKKALQRDLDKLAAAGIAVTHLVMKCRSGETAKVTIAATHEVSLGNAMLSPREITGAG